MFVPVDLLTPILAELRSRGSTGSASAPGWAELRRARRHGARGARQRATARPTSPACEPGDRIVRIDGAEVKALELLWKTLWAGGAPEREVTLDIVRDGRAQTLKLQSVDRMKTLRRAQGI